MRAQASIAIGELRDQGQIDGHAIAPLDPERFQHVRERAHLAVQIPVRQRPSIAGLTFPDDRRFVSPRRADMAVQTICARIQLSTDKPLRVAAGSNSTPLPGLHPVELSREIRPERFRIGGGSPVARTGR